VLGLGQQRFAAHRQ